MTSGPSARVRLAIASAVSLAAPLLAFAALSVLWGGDAGWPAEGAMVLAGTLLFLGGLVDWVDGGIARKLGVSGSFGRFMDLYCDAVSTSIPLALILVALPATLGGVPLPIGFVVGAALVVAVVVRHAAVSDQQVREAVHRHAEFAGLVTPPFLHLIAGALVLFGSGAVVPVAGLDLSGLARDNAALLFLVVAAGTLAINTNLPYLRAGALAMRTPWPWWIALGLCFSLNLGLGLVAMQLFYFLTPVWLRFDMLRETPYRLRRRAGGQA